MTDNNGGHLVSRRGLLLGAAATGLVASASPAGALTGRAFSPAGTCAVDDRSDASLWRVARRRGLGYGSSTAVWQLADSGYRELFERQASMLFTEDDLLWYRLRPTPDSGLRFTHSDRIIDFAARHHQSVFGAHLVWDQGFGPGWTHQDLWGLKRQPARDLLFGTIGPVVQRYRGEGGPLECRQRGGQQR